MSPELRKDLSKAEWKVMKIVWELRKAMAREVYSVAGEQLLFAGQTGLLELLDVGRSRSVSKLKCDRNCLVVT